MTSRDVDVPLSTQRLRELMLWHGTDEANLPPAATLANLSRDTVAALGQLQRLRVEVTELRSTLSRIFWSSDSRTIRTSVLEVLGAPPEAETAAPPATIINWAPSPNGVWRYPEAQQATG